MTANSFVAARDVSHSFPADVEAGRPALDVLDRVSFTAERGSIVAILGPSGAGKSTLLRTLAGLVTPTSGTAVVDGQAVQKPGPERILLFQELHLFHWMTVAENVDFALRARQFPKQSRLVTVDTLLTFVGLTAFKTYYPDELSGGMRQRVALARALAAEPKVLLMDEPFGALDIETRQQLELDFLRLQSERQVTTIFVTHDIRQALFMSDRIVILTDRPAAVQRVVDVPFAKPRLPALRRTHEFHEIEDSLAETLTLSKKGIPT